MTIQDLGSFGELIAAIATVATLAYLAVQVRQNTISTRAATLQSVIQFSIGFVESLYRDPELALLFDRGRRDQQALRDDERARFFYIMLGFTRMAQNVHHQFEQGFMSEDTWNGYQETILRFVDSPGSRQWWQENAERFSGTFRRYLNSELERRIEQVAGANAPTRSG